MRWREGVLWQKGLMEDPTVVRVVEGLRVGGG